MNASGAQRIVVLGHEGQARDQLVTALSDLGVQPAWVGTPAQSDPATLTALNPSRLVISLDPSIELELEPYGELLGQPGITVLFDDAETTRALSGWDLNRWARHLAAKLLGRSVLPSEHQQVPAHPAPVAVPSDMPAPEPETESAAVLSAPVEPLVAAEMPKAASAWQDEGEYDGLAIDAGELEAALLQLDRNLSSGYRADEVKVASFEQLEPLSDAEHSAFHFDAGVSDAAVMAEPAFDALHSADGMDAVALSEPGDDDLQRLIAEAESLENRFVPAPDEVPAYEMAAEVLPEPEPTPVAASAAVPEPVPSKPREFDLSQFSLVEDGYPTPAIETPVPQMPEPAIAAPEPVHALEPMAALPAYAADAADNEGRLYLAISGIGGPGAVRSLVESVPAGFSGILALSQQFANEQLQRLCGQLQKVSAVPVRVCEPEQYLHAGAIYLLPPDYGIQSTPLGYQCQSQGGLRPFIDEGDPEARVLVLSGGNTELAQPLIMAGMLTGNVSAQDPDSCYEPTLARELVNIGAPMLSLDGMAAWFK